MSKVKSPLEKKDLSQKRDRRNAYWGNDKSSRKNIPLSKQLGRRKERLAVNSSLIKLKGEVDADEADRTENVARAKGALARTKAFRKIPDVPLVEALSTQKAWRKRREGKHHQSTK